MIKAKVTTGMWSVTLEFPELPRAGDEILTNGQGPLVVIRTHWVEEAGTMRPVVIVKPRRS